MTVPTTELGTTTDVKALRAIFDPNGLHLVDLGCGAGDLARKLAYVGATVLGVEPDAAQAEKNAAATAVDRVSFVQACAHEMPVDEGSSDGVMFSLSLHHVPKDLMQASIEKAIGVLKPDGFLAVVEPLFAGSYNDCIELFHNEEAVRKDAEAAVKQFAAPHFDRWQQFFYTTETHYDNFDEFSDRYVNMTYLTFHADVVRSDVVRQRFEACREGDRYCLRSPMRIDFFTAKKH
ncbi:MAG: class I SAM-dependent methyltransferase [Pseudomonadota bacterium]